MDIKHLAGLCGEYGAISTPMIYEDWTIATNGRAMLVVKGTVEGVENPCKQSMAKVGNPNGKIVGVERLETLREWIGAYEAPGQCEECGGDGEVMCHECERDGAQCHDCGGDGKADAEVRRGYLFGCPIDGNLLARFLVGLEAAEPVKVIWGGKIEANPRGKDKTDPLYLDAGNWRVVIMPLNVGSGKLAVFGPETVACKEAST